MTRWRRVNEEVYGNGPRARRRGETTWVDRRNSIRGIWAPTRLLLTLAKASEFRVRVAVRASPFFPILIVQA